LKNALVANEETQNIQPGKVALFLGCIAGILILIHLSDQLNRYFFDLPVALIPELYLDEKNSISTYFLTSLFTLSSVLLVLIWMITKKKDDPFANYWFALAIVFLVFSIDKMIILRERINIIFWNYATNLIWSSIKWIITGLLIVVVIIFIRFLLHLPIEDRLVILLAAVLFIGGSVVIDYLTGIFFNLHGEFSIAYSVLTTLEVALEMIGSIVFIFALLNYMGRNGYGIKVRTR
jgi:hypothetical protein